MERPHSTVPATTGHGATALTAEEHPVFIQHSHPNYVGIFVLLLLFTIIEVAITYFPALPQIPLLLVFALLKGVTIVLFYMHLRYDSRVFTMFFSIGLILAISMLLTFMGLFLAHSREHFDMAEYHAEKAAQTGGGAAAAEKK